MDIGLNLTPEGANAAVRTVGVLDYGHARPRPLLDVFIIGQPDGTLLSRCSLCWKTTADDSGASVADDRFIVGNGQMRGRRLNPESRRAGSTSSSELQIVGVSISASASISAFGIPNPSSDPGWPQAGPVSFVLKRSQRGE
jgi:hypothetical protein